MNYVKVRFTSKQHGATAGLVLPASRFSTLTVGQLSRMFPVSEFRKMETVETSDAYATWDEAFAHDFDAEVSR